MYTEEWKPIPDYPGYEASNMGQIRSYHTKTNKNHSIPHILKPSPRHGNRLYVTIFKDKRPYQVSIHRLTLLTFVGPCPTDMEACHSDGNCINNKLENLRWDTRKANWEDGLRLGTAIIGQRSPNTHLTEEEVIAIRVLYHKRISLRSLATIFHIGQTTLRHIICGKTWKRIGGPRSQTHQGDRSHNIYLQ